MSDIVKYLQNYPDDHAAVMSKARVEEAVAEIERLRAESVVNRHIISCLREEIRLERDARQMDEEQIRELLAERDALRKLLCEARDWLSPDPADGQLLARIDAALKERGDE